MFSFAAKRKTYFDSEKTIAPTPFKLIDIRLKDNLDFALFQWKYNHKSVKIRILSMQIISVLENITGLDDHLRYFTRSSTHFFNLKLKAFKN